MAELTEERFIEILDERLKAIPSKSDYASLSTQVQSLPSKTDYNSLSLAIQELPTKEDYRALKVVVEDIKEKVDRLDKRTDEDTRAVIRDVDKLKTKYA